MPTARGVADIRARVEAIASSHGSPYTERKDDPQSLLSDSDLAAFYRRYNACCNEHRFADLAEFVRPTS
jgi:hypothetical protein